MADEEQHIPDSQIKPKLETIPRHPLSRLAFFAQSNSATVTDSVYETTPSNLTNFYKMYFLFGFYLCITPFRLIVVATKETITISDGDSFLVQVKPWLPQKIIWAVVWFFGQAQALYYCRLAFSLNDTSPSKYFEFVYLFLLFWGKLLTMKNFFRNPTMFEDVTSSLGRIK